MCIFSKKSSYFYDMLSVGWEKRKRNWKAKLCVKEKFGESIDYHNWEAFTRMKVIHKKQLTDTNNNISFLYHYGNLHTKLAPTILKLEQFIIIINQFIIFLHILFIILNINTIRKLKC